ncbi:MAG: hypothetical protein AB7G06_08525 [Bdellovibrionales bacterium]
MLVFTQTGYVSDSPYALKPLGVDALAAVAALEQACVTESNVATGYLGAVQTDRHRMDLLAEGGTMTGAFDENDALVAQQLGRFLPAAEDLQRLNTAFDALNASACVFPTYLMYNNFTARIAQNKKLHEKFLAHGIATATAKGVYAQIFQASPRNVTVMRSGLRNGFMLVGCGMHNGLKEQQLVFVRQNNLSLDAAETCALYPKEIQPVALQDWQKLADRFESDYVGVALDITQQIIYLLPYETVRQASADQQQERNLLANA